MEKLNLPKYFTDHPLVKRIILEEETTITAKRSAALAEIAKLESQYEHDRPAVEAEIEKTGQAVKGAAEALDEARRTWGAASYKKMVLNVEFDGLYRAQKSILLATYPPEINEFEHDMLNKLADLPKTFRLAKRAGADHFFLDDEPALIESNAEAIGRASDYLRAAIAEAEAWKTADISGIDIVKRLEELRAGIPNADVFETNEQALPDISALKGHVEPLRKPRLEWFNGALRPIGGW